MNLEILNIWGIGMKLHQNAEIHALGHLEIFIDIVLKKPFRHAMLKPRRALSGNNSLCSLTIIQTNIHIFC